MLRIFLPIALFFGIIYGIFKLFFFLSNSLLLIDEGFINYIKTYNDPTIKNLLNDDDLTNKVVSKATDNTIEKNSIEKNNIETRKKLNRHLRLDFFISLLFGIIWFLFPLMIINIPNNENRKKTIYIGKTLGLFTLISSLWPLFNISDPNFEKKLNILKGKFICACLTILSFLIIVFFRKTMSFGNIISVILTSIWLANGYYGL